MGHDERDRAVSGPDLALALYALVPAPTLQPGFVWRPAGGPDDRTADLVVGAGAIHPRAPRYPPLDPDLSTDLAALLCRVEGGTLARLSFDHVTRWRAGVDQEGRRDGAQH